MINKSEVPNGIMQQINLELRMTINQKLPIATKDGYYLSSFFIDKFNNEYLNQVLRDWSIIDKTEFNSKLKDFIDNSLDEIQYETIKAIPKRQEIINSIFELYRVKNYIPIIPLVLSQADGIMKEFVKSGLYTSELSKLKFQNSDFYVNFLSNYEQLLNIENRNDYELFMKDISDMTKFNRHSILHGESFEFGNELNAIKAILLFTFIVEVHGANSEN